MSADKVAIVTGANKGIGFAIVKGLCKRFDGVVYLTSRDEERGQTAVKNLKKESCYAVYHQLDVSDKASVKKFSEYIQKKHGGIDILINNAGVAGDRLFFDSYESKKNVIDINYNSLLSIEEYLFPLLKNNARVVNMSSNCGHLSNVKNSYWIERLSRKDLTRGDIEEFVNWYLDGERAGTFKRYDLADGTLPAYRVSKVAMSALTMIQQKDVEARGVSVNSMHPGFVSTDMVSNFGVRTPDEAAKTALYLVLDAPSSLKGKYIWFNGKEVDWYDYKTDYYFKLHTLSLVLMKHVISYPLKIMSFPMWSCIFFAFVVFTMMIW